MAIGAVDTVAGLDIVAMTTGTNLLTFSNNGGLAFTATTTDVLVAATGVTLADVGGNSRPDVLLVSPGATPGQLRVLVNTSTATVSYATRLDFNVDAAPQGLAVADTNQDGRLDVATVSGSALGVGTATILQNAGVGNAAVFRIETNLTLAGNGNPSSAVAAYFNDDDLLDLAIANRQTNTVRVFLATAEGVYGPGVNVSTVVGGMGGQPVSLVAADLLGNGTPDLIVASASSSVVVVLANNGMGGFAPTASFATGAGPSQVVTGDFNEDGRLDLAVSHNGGSPASRGVSVLLNTGGRNFGPRREFLAGTSAVSLVAGDFNRDNNLDLAVLNNAAPGSVRILTGNGRGSFSAIVPPITAVVSPTYITAGDFNRDGFLDLAVVSGSNSTTNNVGVILNAQGAGFGSVQTTTLLRGLTLQSAFVTDVNLDAFPDLVVTVNQEFDTVTFPASRSRPGSPTACTPCCRPATAPSRTSRATSPADSSPGSRRLPPWGRWSATR